MKPKRITVTLQQTGTGAYLISRLTNAIAVNINGLSFTVGKYIEEPALAEKLAEDPRYEVTVNSCKQ